MYYIYVDCYILIHFMQGSMKEVRDQTLQSYRTINRKFRDQFLNQTLLHFICQEGYYPMLQFVIDPKNHSVFEDEGRVIMNYVHICIIHDSAGHQPQGCEGQNATVHVLHPSHCNLPGFEVRPRGGRIPHAHEVNTTARHIFLR